MTIINTKTKNNHLINVFRDGEKLNNVIEIDLENYTFKSIKTDYIQNEDGTILKKLIVDEIGNAIIENDSLKGITLIFE